MPDLKEKAITLLSRTLEIDANADATLHPLFTVPPGKRAIIIEVIVHSNADSLAGMDDVNFGGGPTGVAPSWIVGEASIAGVISANKFIVIRDDNDDNLFIEGDAAVANARTFSMYVVSGSTVASTVTVDVFGYLVDGIL